MNGHRERMLCFVESTGSADLFQLVLGAAVDFHLELAGPHSQALFTVALTLGTFTFACQAGLALFGCFVCHGWLLISTGQPRPADRPSTPGRFRLVQGKLFLAADAVVQTDIARRENAVHSVSHGTYTVALAGVAVAAIKLFRLGMVLEHVRRCCR